MRKKLINTFKFNELSKSIQENYLKDYLENNQDSLMLNLAKTFFQDKGFLEISTFISDDGASGIHYYVDSDLTTNNLVLLNSYFSIPNHEKIDSIKLRSGHMSLGYSCCQPDIKVSGSLTNESLTELESRLETYWTDCCSEFLTLLTKELDESNIRQLIINLNQDFLETGALIP